LVNRETSPTTGADSSKLFLTGARKGFEVEEKLGAAVWNPELKLELG
jgi:hypothetical protein